MSSLARLEPSIRLSIQNPASEKSSVFGKGISDLCKGVRDKGSLNAAAKDIGMAYSKAWRIIKETEDTLGIQLLIRDGAHGSELTEEGSRLLSMYEAISKKLSQEAFELYKELSQ